LESVKKDTKAGLEIRRVPLESLHLDPANARSHHEENLSAIEASLHRFGQAEPLITHKPSGRVIGGNGRLVAMKRLGWTEADIVELDVDDLTATALGIALNRTAELAEWDETNLGRLLQELQAADALDGVGFDSTDIDALLESLGELEVPEVTDPGPEELPACPVSKPGDLWLLGDHMLACADCRDPAVHEKLLGTAQVDMVWTDPPYGVAYTGGTEDALQIENDDLDPSELEAFLREAFEPACRATKPGGVWYVAAPAGPNFLPFAKVLAELGIWRQTLVWLKDALVLGRSDFHYRHEALFYGWRPGAAHQPPPGRDQDTVWEVDRPRVSRDHPTMKPVELVTRAILTSSGPRSLVLDPFAGSGTTLVAAESTGRVSRCIELDPRYVDVGVKRWQAATGREATLEGDGRAFEEMAEEREAGDGKAQ
jgi:DNA modification methylase